jgi:hypothetical protein
MQHDTMQRRFIDKEFKVNYGHEMEMVRINAGRQAHWWYLKPIVQTGFKAWNWLQKYFSDEKNVFKLRRVYGTSYLPSPPYRQITKPKWHAVNNPVYLSVPTMYELQRMNTLSSHDSLTKHLCTNRVVTLQHTALNAKRYDEQNV